MKIPYLVSYVEIEDWGECGEYFRIIFADSPANAVAIFSAVEANESDADYLETVSGMGGPYVYQISSDPETIKNAIGWDLFDEFAATCQSSVFEGHPRELENLVKVFFGHEVTHDQK